ncbi:MAG TPA: hypothetical protein VFV86_00450 [Nitrososphaeraceae archaeon]|nr:hypothetical protein [Nitrososphaeraceae archaeon]
MQNIKKYSIIAFLTLSLVAGIFNNIPSLYAQGGNQTDTTATTMEDNSMANMTEGEHDATGEDDHEAYEEKDHKEASSVRDSVTLLLQDNLIPAEDFIHLYDSSPYHIMNGHVAIKVPCEDDSTTSIQVLIGSAPNMTAAELENIAPLSTPGDQCLYHVDLIPSGNVTVLTDVALKNSGDEDIEFPPTSTAVIGINEVKKVEHGHAEDAEEEHGGNSTATITAEDIQDTE